MARRMSNRERIERRALEVAAEDKEKATKKTTKKTAKKTAKKTSSTTKKKVAAAKGRLKMVWVVLNDRFTEVGTFPYSEKDAADAKAAALTKKSGKQHVVNPVKVPADDE